MENILREIREDIGMSISELARRSSTSRQTIHAIENGERKDISGSLLLKISEALKKDPRGIFFTKNVTHELQVEE